MPDNATARAACMQAVADRARGVRDRLHDRDAENLERKAAELLATETAAEVKLGEVAQPVEDSRIARIRALELHDTLANPDQVSRDASAERTELLLRSSVDITALALDAADTIDASNSIEKMLAHQLTLAHKAAFEMADKSLSLAQRIDHHNDPRTMQIMSIESARLMNSSARMMRAFQQGMATFQKIRTGGNQTMTVQHVHVSDGGQALIGNVAGASGEGDKK